MFSFPAQGPSPSSCEAARICLWPNKRQPLRDASSDDIKNLGWLNAFSPEHFGGCRCCHLGALVMWLHGRVCSAVTSHHRLSGLAHTHMSSYCRGTESSIVLSWDGVSGPGIAVLAGPAGVRSCSVFLHPPAGKGGSGPCHTASLWPPPLPLLPHRRTLW